MVRMIIVEYNGCMKLADMKRIKWRSLGMRLTATPTIVVVKKWHKAVKYDNELTTYANYLKIG